MAAPETVSQLTDEFIWGPPGIPFPTMGDNYFQDPEDDGPCMVYFGLIGFGQGEKLKAPEYLFDWMKQPRTTSYRRA